MEFMENDVIETGKRTFFVMGEGFFDLCSKERDRLLRELSEQVFKEMDEVVEKMCKNDKAKGSVVSSAKILKDDWTTIC